MQQIGPVLCWAVLCSLALSLQFYSHKASSLRHPDWVGQLDSGIPLRKLSIIGSHSSMSQGAWGDAFQTQSNSLANQMLIGMRALDIRCRHEQNQLKIYDRIVYLNSDLGGVLATVRSFLQAHPLEVLLMHIVEQGSPSGNSNTFQAAFLTYYNSFLDIIWAPTSQNPSLGEVRGKVVIIQDFTASAIYGLLYSTFTVLPHKRYSTNWDQYDKWLAVKSFLVGANSAGVSQLSFWTGNVGSFPYFVASGQSSPNNGDPLLATGLTTPGFKSSYPDFPRVGCFIGICTIAFQGINNLAFNYVISKNLTYIGVVFTDFIGDDVISKSIAFNTGKFVPCPIAQKTQGCSYCSSTAQCLGCNTTLNYLYQASTSSCLAAPGYYLAWSNTTANLPVLCSSAISGCLTCSSPTLCLSCDLLAHYTLAGGTCAAAAGYYLDAANVPVACSLVGCQQCQSASACLNCSSAANYIINGASACECNTAALFTENSAVPACVCMAGYYLAADNTCQTVPLCPANNSGCSTCDPGPPCFCTLCDSASHFIDDPSNASLCICDTGYFFDGTLCLACSSSLSPSCVSCASQSLCLGCQANFTLANGVCSCVSQYYRFNASTCLQCSTGCLICTNASTCQVCDTASNFVSTPNGCSCLDGMFLSGSMCVPCGAIVGCLTCNNASCTSCDAIFGFSLNPTTNSCECSPGNYVSQMKVCTQCTQLACVTCTSLATCTSCTAEFQLNGGICKEICGDGVLFTLACDDGNLANGDGCSSSCLIQADYTCVGGSTTSASSCSFSGTFNFTVLSMTKDPAANTVYLSALIEPALAELANLDFSSVFIPDFPVLESNAVYNLTTGIIALTFTYNTSLNNATLAVSFLPPALPAYFYMPTTKISLPDVTNNNLALKVYSPEEYQNAKKMEVLVWGVTLSAVGLFLVGFFFVSKLMAIEMILIFQVSYAGLLLLQKLQLFMVPLRNLKITNGYNELLPGSTQGLPGRISQIHYTTTFLSNFSMDLIIFALPLILGAILSLVGKIGAKKRIRVIGYKIIKQWWFSGLLFVQIHLGVSLSLDFLYNSQKIVGFAIGGAILLSILIQLFVFVRSPKNFGEYKQFFKEGRFRQNWYVLVTLCRSFICLCLGYFSNAEYCGYAALGIAAALLLGQAILRPYESNIRPFVNNITLISVLAIYQFCKIHRNSTQVTLLTSYMAFFLIGLLCFTLVFNLICMIIRKVELWRLGKDRRLADETLLKNENQAKNIDKDYVEQLKQQLKMITLSNKDNVEANDEDQITKSARKLKMAIKDSLHSYELELSEVAEPNNIVKIRENQ